MLRSTPLPRAPQRFHVRVADTLLCAAFLLSYPLAAFVPQRWAVENGILENTQVAVLAYGCLAAVLAYRRHRKLPLAALGACVTPIWIILAARELSWGAVVTQADAVSAGLPLQDMWYQDAVAPAILAALAWSAWMFWRHRLHRLMLRVVRGGGFVLFPLLLAVLASYGSACAEGHVVCGIHVDPSREEAWEEGLEMIAYVALVQTQRLIFRACLTRAAPARHAPAREAMTEE